MKDIDLRNLYQEEEYEEKETKTKINKIKEKIKHFPTLVLNFLKKLFNGLFKTRGSGIIITILILYIFGALDLVYYKIGLNISEYKINLLENRLSRIKNELEQEQRKKECIGNQIIRIGEGKEIDFNYCNQNSKG